MKDMNWERWLAEGKQYLKAVSGKNGAPSRFSSTIQYNLLSMSMESYVMAAVDYHHMLPDNHTFWHLLDALQQVYDLDPELREKIMGYEDAQLICSLDTYHTEELSLEALADFKEAVEEVAAICEGICTGPRPALAGS